MQIVLVEPQIPQNTGNIVRTCAVTGASLILVEPMGFRVSDRQLKRAGLDYWLGVDVQIIDNLEELLLRTTAPFYFFSSKVTTPYTTVHYPQDAILIFGSESKGLPTNYFNQWPDRFLTIPMRSDARCLNLSNAAAIVLYEAFRQQNFLFSCHHQ
jgi:tRNA (cytidine/uridine-2'-O-)-methyltransferase